MMCVYITCDCMLLYTVMNYWWKLHVHKTKYCKTFDTQIVPIIIKFYLPITYQLRKKWNTKGYKLQEILERPLKYP